MLPVQSAQVPEPGRHDAGHGFEKYLDDTATALPQGGPQRETTQGQLLLVQHPCRDARALVFQLTAADRANGLRRRDDHLRADLPGRRAADAGDGDQHGRLTGDRFRSSDGRLAVVTPQGLQDGLGRRRRLQVRRRLLVVRDGVADRVERRQGQH